MSFIVERGAEWFAGIGREKNTGPKLFCLSGRGAPRCLRDRDGHSFKTLFQEHGGGLLTKRPLKAVIPGGSSAPVMTAAECDDLLMDFDSLAAKGACSDRPA